MGYFYSPFRKEYNPDDKTLNEDCVFCSQKLLLQLVMDPTGKPVENQYYRWAVNWYPRFEGHTMLIPKKHVMTFEEENRDEVSARHHLMIYARKILAKLYNADGVEVFLQTGEGSKSSVKHLHWHLVPSSPADPLRSIDKLGQFFTTEDGKERVVMFPIPIKFAREELQIKLRELIDEIPYVE